MRYQYVKIDQSLNNHVRTALVLEENSNSRSSELPMVTKGMSTLLCKIENNNFQITLHGQTVPDEQWIIENKQQSIIAFFFKPFSLSTIFKLSAKALKEKPVELNQWNAQKTIAVGVQLVHAKSIEEKVAVLGHFIHAQIQLNQRECEIIQYATDKILSDSGTDVLAALLSELKLTERTFQRIFKKYVGVTPGQFRRICQFHLSFTQLREGEFESMTDVAFDNGFADQSHFIRSFKEFTQTTPNSYVRHGLKDNK